MADKKVTKSNSKKALVVIDNDDPFNPAKREAPEERGLVFQSLIQKVISEAQFNILYGKTPAWAIKRREGPGGQMLRYVPHGFTRDQLNKAFGLDWDWKLLPIFNNSPFHQVERNEKGKTKQYLTVIGELTVRIRNPENIKEILTTITKTGTGSSLWNEGVEFGDALKSADSDALKRAGLGLGIALDLYYSEDTAVAKHAEIEQRRKAEQEEVERVTPEKLEQAKLMLAEGETPKTVAEALGLKVSDLSKAELL